MTIVNIICPICTEMFKNGDDIFTTNCGHLFHYICLQNWMKKENSCPQCRKARPPTHKLHLSFDEEVQRPESEQDLEIKLESSNEKVAELLAQKQERESNFLKLQEQFTLIDAAKRDLEIKTRQVNNVEDEFLRLQAKYTEASEIQKQLEDSINQLIIENACKTRELEKRAKENENLKASLVAEEAVGGLSENETIEKIKLLEQKIEIATAALEKEVNITTMLNVDKIKLEKYIENYKSKENKENSTTRESNKNSSNSKGINQKTATNNSNGNMNEHASSVLIKGLTLSQLTVPLENSVFNLAAKMKLSLSLDDVIKLNIMDSNKQMQNGIVLYVQFKDTNIKQTFLANKKYLNNDPDTKSIIIEEYMKPTVSNELQELLSYTKRELHDRGYQFYYFEDNKLFIKRYKNHPDILHISNKGQVDAIASMWKSNRKIRT